MEIPEIFEFMQLFSIVMAGLVANPIYSVLFLILTYLISSISIITNDNDLVIGILLILVYIGAVSILFLFSILLLDLHSASIYGTKISILTIFLISILFFFCEFISIYSNNKEFNMILDTQDIYDDWLTNFYASSEFSIIAHLLYNELFLVLLLAIIALFVSLLGAITIALTGATRLRRQVTNQQLIRQSHSYLYHKIKN